MEQKVPLAHMEYNFMPNEHFKESPFCLMFGGNPILPLNAILSPKLRYVGPDENILSLEALQSIYERVAQNFKIARKKRDTKLPFPLTQLLKETQH